MTDSPVIFDRAFLRRRLPRGNADSGNPDFLFQEVAERLRDRLADISRTFPDALDLGGRTGVAPETFGVERLIVSAQPQGGTDNVRSPNAVAGLIAALVADEELLPFGDNTFDLIASNLSLHWVNDLPGALIQIRHALRPDGLFLATIFGGDTLNELRDCLLSAESELLGGASPRISPMVALGDAAGLLQRAGFSLPVADLDRINVTYKDAFRLMADLRGMGETNAVHGRMKHFTPRSVMMRAAALYQERYADNDGRINATFDVIFLHGWAPHESQQQPLRPGSAVARLADALEAEETSLGDSATPSPKTK
ncbi:MAG: methyltransferase domain-containing protein [Alphaproteobacteria bacterium]|nr:methyltransferase domain-containing protein [Alphaproteobacteria bacterium]